MKAHAQELDAIDRRIIAATQDGLPLDPHPYRVVAELVGIEADDVMNRMRRMLDSGAIRRIGVVPNHYALGVTANGMSVWDVADDAALEAGRLVGSLSWVTHCYRRPRHRPQWPYNLFAMVHGRDRSEVLEQVKNIADLLGDSCFRHDVLFSTRILKKTGLRITDQGKSDV